MNAFLRGILAVAVVVLPALAQASYYERYTYYVCGKPYYGYRPVAYAAPRADYKSEANNYSRTFTFNYSYYNSPAQQGNTAYGLSNFDPSGFAGKVVNSSATLAEKFIQASAKTAGDASVFDQQAVATQGVVAREIVANQRLQLLSQATEVRTPVVVQQVAPQVPPPPVPGPFTGNFAQGSLAATEQACLACHAANVAESKGNGNVISSFAAFSAQDADLALDYITRLDANNCGRKANLSPEAHRELRQFLCKKSNQ